jgi:hypothetical protein
MFDPDLDLEHIVPVRSFAELFAKAGSFISNSESPELQLSMVLLAAIFGGHREAFLGETRGWEASVYALCIRNRSSLFVIAPDLERFRRKRLSHVAPALGQHSIILSHQ